MLVISRKLGEEVRIGSAVVKINRVRGRQVWLAIDAPREVPITRPSTKKSEADKEEKVSK